MPIKMSIEVVRHSRGDYRVIFKDNGFTHRKSFSNLYQMLDFLHANIEASDVAWTDQDIDF